MLPCFTHLVGIPRTGGLNICQRFFSTPRTGLWCHSNGIIIPIVYLRCAKAANQMTFALSGKMRVFCLLLPFGNQTWLASKTPITGGLNEKLIERNRDFQQARFDYRRAIERRWICPKKKGTQKTWMSLRQCMIMFCWFSISIFW